VAQGRRNAALSFVINHPRGGSHRTDFRGTGRTRYSAPMYLLRYKREGEWRLVVIADAYSVAHARMVAAELNPGRFVDGHRVSRASVARLPPEAVGRVLTLADLMALAKDKKKRPARSVWPPHGDAL
jgi:hypothetical protein